MTRNRNYLPDDWLEIFINRVRSVGVWCDTKVTDKYRHYFVCRNENATIAISLCGQIIAPFEKLHENHVTIKCLICDLYLLGREEVKQLILTRHDKTIDELTPTLTQDKE